MNAKNLTALVAMGVVAGSGAAFAGGLDRDTYSNRLLFETGTYAEISLSSVKPEVSGVGTGGAFAGRQSGDMADDYTMVSFGYRRDFSENLSFALSLYQPYGADVKFPAGNFPFANTFAQLDSQELVGVLRYEFANNISVFGGLRASELSGDIYVSTPLFTYRSTVDSDTQYSYLVGAAWERPELGQRVALTFMPGADYTMTGNENPGAAGAAPGAIAVAPTSYVVSMPDVILLEAQTGVSQNTLLSASVRHVLWGGFALTPNRYPAGRLTSYSNDVTTYTIGLGHRLNENWAVSANYSYEESKGGFAGNLGPTDGFDSIGLGVEYRQDAFSIAAGVRRVDIGDAQTNLGGGTVSDYSGNSATAIGVRFGYRF